MSRTRLIGWTAFAVCILGYGGFAAAMVMARMDVIAMREALLFGVPAVVVGEAGLWVAAGCLGWTLFKGRKALLDRLFRRKPKTV